MVDDIGWVSSPSSPKGATPGTTLRPSSSCVAAPRVARRAKRGGARRDRTADLLHAMQALSQLSYGPVARARKIRDRVLDVKERDGIQQVVASTPCISAKFRARARTHPGVHSGNAQANQLYSSNVAAYLEGGDYRGQRNGSLGTYSRPDRYTRGLSR